MEDRSNPSYPGKRGPYLDDAGEPIPASTITEAHEEFDTFCKALIIIAEEIYIQLGSVKDPQWLAEHIIERYEETDYGFLDVLRREDIVEAAGLAQWQTRAAKAFSEAFRALVAK